MDPQCTSAGPNSSHTIACRLSLAAQVSLLPENIVSLRFTHPPQLNERSASNTLGTPVSRFKILGVVYSLNIIDISSLDAGM